MPLESVTSKGVVMSQPSWVSTRSVVMSWPFKVIFTPSMTIPLWSMIAAISVSAPANESSILGKLVGSYLRPFSVIVTGTEAALPPVNSLTVIPPTDVAKPVASTLGIKAIPLPCSSEPLLQTMLGSVMSVKTEPSATTALAPSAKNSNWLFWISMTCSGPIVSTKYPPPALFWMV